MKKRISILLVIIWMILIFIMSSFNATESSNQSGLIVNIISNIFNINNLDTLSFIIRKLAHFSEYFILGILVCNTIKQHNKKTYIAIIICILYALSDETHQIFVSGREFKLLDIFVDSVGSLLGILVYKYVLDKINKYRCTKKINKK